MLVWHRRQNLLFHDGIKVLCKSLKEAFDNPETIECNDGWCRKIRPLVAAWLGDREEHEVISQVVKVKAYLNVFCACFLVPCVCCSLFLSDFVSCCAEQLSNVLHWGLVVSGRPTHQLHWQAPRCHQEGFGRKMARVGWIWGTWASGWCFWCVHQSDEGNRASERTQVPRHAQWSSPVSFLWPSSTGILFVYVCMWQKQALTCFCVLWTDSRWLDAPVQPGNVVACIEDHLLRDPKISAVLWSANHIKSFKIKEADIW